MKITIPKPSHPNSGLVFVKGSWRASFSRDGRRLYRTLRTAEVTVARERRDALYDSLRKAGATEPVRTAKTATPDDRTWIYRRKPYFVRVQGVRIGDYDTIEEARAARNAHLKIA